MTHQSRIARLEIQDSTCFPVSLFRDVHSGALFNILWPCSDLSNFGILLFRDGKRIGAGTVQSCRPGSSQKQFVGLGAIAQVNGHARSSDVPLDYLLADYFSAGDHIEIHDDHQLRESRDADPDFFSVIFSEFLNSAPAEEMLYRAWERAYDLFWRKTGLSFREWRQVRALLRGTFHLQYGCQPDEWCQSLAHEFQEKWNIFSEDIMRQWRATYSGENAEPMLWFPD